MDPFREERASSIIADRTTVQMQVATRYFEDHSWYQGDVLRLMQQLSPEAYFGRHERPEWAASLEQLIKHEAQNSFLPIACKTWP